MMEVFSWSVDSSTGDAGAILVEQSREDGVESAIAELRQAPQI